MYIPRRGTALEDEEAGLVEMLGPSVLPSGYVVRHELNTSVSVDLALKDSGPYFLVSVFGVYYRATAIEAG